MLQFSRADDEVHCQIFTTFAPVHIGSWRNLLGVGQGWLRWTGKGFHWSSTAWDKIKEMAHKYAS